MGVQISNSTKDCRETLKRFLDLYNFDPTVHPRKGIDAVLGKVLFYLEESVGQGPRSREDKRRDCREAESALTEMNLGLPKNELAGSILGRPEDELAESIRDRLAKTFRRVKAALAEKPHSSVELKERTATTFTHPNKNTAGSF